MPTKEATTSAPDKKSQGNKPVIALREGGCVVSVFANPHQVQGQTVNRYRVTLYRRERRDEGFETKYSFRIEDLERLQEMICNAKQQILEYDTGALGDDSNDSQAEEE